jgi:ubiquinone/menaquinone biosynthesis C-methylase UbiE
MNSGNARCEWNAFARANAAQRWKRQSAAMGRHMTEAIVAEAKVEPGMRVLDVACGTGEPAISIALLLSGTGLVLGIDISSEPLRLAKQRARERGLANVRFQQADVHSLPFADGSFDRVTSRLGIMFFSDLPRALREMHRVLNSSGRVTLLAWGPMQQPYFESTIGTILRVSPGTALPASGSRMFKFGEAGKLAAALENAGFRRVEEELRVVPWSWPGTPKEVWDYFREVTVPFRPLIEAVPNEKRGVVEAEVLREIGRYYDGGCVNFTATICLASATRGDALLRG